LVEVRLELKSLFQSSAVEAIHRIQRIPGFFIEEYPPRQVNNVYFDTLNMKYFWDHVNGLSSRLKYRVRWYGENHTDKVQAFFEVKKKAGQISTKFRSEGVELDLREPIYYPDEHQLRPVLVSTFQRSYYCDHSGDIRITVDEMMAFSSMPGPYYSLPTQAPFEHLTVLEIKSPVEVRQERLEEVMGALPRIQKFSKYIHGVNQVNAA
jgi:SPX domain protein involved in polyphosphate accumulation